MHACRVQNRRKLVYRKTVAELCKIAKQNESKEKRISARDEIIKRLDNEKMSAEDLLVLACYNLDEDLALKAAELLTSNYQMTIDMLLEVCKSGMTIAVKQLAKNATIEKIENQGDVSASKLRTIVLSTQSNEIKRAAAAQLVSRQNLDATSLAATICLCTDSKSASTLFEKLKEIQRPGDMTYISQSCKFPDIKAEARLLRSNYYDESTVDSDAITDGDVGGAKSQSSSPNRRLEIEAEVAEANLFRHAEEQRIKSGSFFARVKNFFRTF